MNFELPLTEEKVKRQQVITLHLIVTFTLLATSVCLLLVRFLINSLSEEQRSQLQGFSLPVSRSILVGMAGLALLGLLLFRNAWLTSPRINRIVRFAELFMVLGMASFAAYYGMMVAALIFGVVSAAVFFAVYWEGIADNTLYISVSERGIRLPVTYRKKFLDWWEVEQVLLRFGVVTIDCCDNRLFQWNIRDINFDKEYFQRFCLEQITASREKRRKYAW